MGYEPGPDHSLLTYGAIVVLGCALIATYAVTGPMGGIVKKGTAKDTAAAKGAAAAAGTGCVIQ